MKNSYETPEAMLLEILGAGVICTSPSGGLSDFTYTELGEGEGFITVED